jgi:hypothetical protein
VENKMNLKIAIVISAAALAGCAQEARHSDLEFKDAPLAVRSGIEKAFPDAQVKDLEKEVYKENNAVHYKVDLVTKYGEEKHVEFAPDGELLEKH